MKILNEIVELDKKAAARAEAEIDAERKRSAEFGNAAAKSRAEKLEAEREKIQKLRGEQEKILSEKLSGAEKEKDRRCKELSDIFSENKARWKSEIISRITEG
ncbi:MAG: hypothetical protein J1F03_01110 [Oscillospiraceae bacterium]|nr:hypothetical protein [Oscillospiraceae bacterium]